MENTNTTENAAPATIHPWEAAGLGQAPYRYIGVSREYYQAVPGDPACPLQPGSSCDYCGQAIVETYRFRSADGRTFKVGCDCVRKFNAKGSRVLTEVERAHRKLLTEQRQTREAAKIDQAKAYLDSVTEQLLARPSLTAWRAEQGDTLADYVAFVWSRSGTAGKLRLVKTIAQTLEVR